MPRNLLGVGWLLKFFCASTRSGTSSPAFRHRQCFSGVALHHMRSLLVPAVDADAFAFVAEVSVAGAPSCFTHFVFQVARRIGRTFKLFAALVA